MWEKAGGGIFPPRIFPDSMPGKQNVPRRKAGSTQFTWPKGWQIDSKKIQPLGAFFGPTANSLNFLKSPGKPKQKVFVSLEWEKDRGLRKKWAKRNKNPIGKFRFLEIT